MASQSEFDPKGPTAQLLMLKGMTEKFGIIHEAQALQLRLMPFAVDPDLAKHRVELNLDDRHLVFHWEADRSPGWKPDGDYLNRLAEMNKAIKTVLLGEGYSVEVLMNGAPIFTSGSNDPNVERPAERKRLPFWKRLLGRSE